MARRKLMPRPGETELFYGEEGIIVKRDKPSVLSGKDVVKRFERNYGMTGDGLRPRFRNSTTLEGFKGLYYQFKLFGTLFPDNFVQVGMMRLPDDIPPIFDIDEPPTRKGKPFFPEIHSKFVDCDEVWSSRLSKLYEDVIFNDDLSHEQVLPEIEKYEQMVQREGGEEYDSLLKQFMSAGLGLAHAEVNCARRKNGKLGFFEPCGEISYPRACRHIRSLPAGAQKGNAATHLRGAFRNELAALDRISQSRDRLALEVAYQLSQPHHVWAGFPLAALVDEAVLGKWDLAGRLSPEEGTDDVPKLLSTLKLVRSSTEDCIPSEPYGRALDQAPIEFLENTWTAYMRAIREDHKLYPMLRKRCLLKVAGLNEDILGSKGAIG